MMNQKNKIHTIVATSGFILPVAALIATLLWVAENVYDWSRLLGWLFCGINTYLWIETNNTHALMRVRSLMTPSLFVLLVGITVYLHQLQDAWFVCTFMLISYYQLFQSYQNPSDVGAVFHAFLCIGLGSLFFPQLLYFVPFYLWYSVVFLRSLSLRGFCAALVGTVLPYWFAGAYCLAAGKTGWLLEHFSRLIVFQPFDRMLYASLSVTDMISLAVLVFLVLIGSGHYLKTCFNDKIKTRMFYYLIIAQELLLLIFILLQPVHFRILYVLFLMNTAPILAHYFVFAKGRFSLILFLCMLMSFFIIAVLNLWIPL